MHEPIVEQILSEIQAANGRYNRLVLLVGENEDDLSSVMSALGAKIDADVLNINFLVSAKMMEFPAQKRGMHLQGIMQDLLEDFTFPALLGHTAILFEKTLQQDPLVLLSLLSRNKTIVAAWHGKVDGESLVYAEPGHPEHRKYDDCDALIVNIDESM